MSDRPVIFPPVFLEYSDEERQKLSAQNAQELTAARQALRTPARMVSVETLNRIAALLAQFEWVGDDQMPHCDSCGVERWNHGDENNHRPGCELDAVLGLVRGLLK